MLLVTYFIRVAKLELLEIDDEITFIKEFPRINQDLADMNRPTFSNQIMKRIMDGIGHRTKNICTESMMWEVLKGIYTRVGYDTDWRTWIYVDLQKIEIYSIKGFIHCVMTINDSLRDKGQDIMKDNLLIEITKSVTHHHKLWKR